MTHLIVQSCLIDPNPSRTSTTAPLWEPAVVEGSLRPRVARRARGEASPHLGRCALPSPLVGDEEMIPMPGAGEWLR
jgi:hypothetical protein